MPKLRVSRRTQFAGFLTTAVVLVSAGVGLSSAESDPKTTLEQVAPVATTNVTSEAAAKSTALTQAPDIRQQTAAGMQ